MAVVDINSPVLKSFVKAWMREHAGHHVDSCGELDLTGLAETAADEFEVYDADPDATIPEWVFDMASDVSQLRKEYHDAGTNRYHSR